MRVLGIAGSLREGSHNLALLWAAAALLPPDAELQERSGLADLPACNEDLDGRSIEKSSGLFFLTSGTNVLALEGGALLLGLGLGAGSHPLLLAVIPAALGIAGTAMVLALPRSSWHRRRRSAGVAPVVDGIRQAQHALVRAHWRLLGALGYLGFDIAVLGLTCAGVGHPIGVPALVLAYIIGYAANSLPVPGGIGVLEGGLVGTLVLYGAPVMPATAAVLLYHTIAFWIPSLGGAIAYTLTTLGGRARSDAETGYRPCEGRARALARRQRQQVLATIADAR
jgi:hypothetical protein